MNKAKRMEEKDKRMEDKELRLASKGYIAVDEGRDRKADRLLGRAANIQDKRIRMNEKWENSIKNPENKEFVGEVAFNMNKNPKKVTQKEFAKRYKLRIKKSK